VIQLEPPSLRARAVRPAPGRGATGRHDDFAMNHAENRSPIRDERACVPSDSGRGAAAGEAAPRRIFAKQGAIERLNSARNSEKTLTIRLQI